MSDPGSRATDRTTRRLTVARADEAARRKIVEQVRCTIIDEPALEAAAESVAAERRSARASLHNRAQADEQRAADALALAEGREQAVRGRQEALRDGARWARQADDEVMAARGAVTQAEADLEAKQAEQRRALARLDRVLEQRAAAGAAMAEAEEQLADLGVAELDESGLRRHLEASGQAVREARERHAAAVAALDDRRAELAVVVARHEAAAEGLAQAARSDVVGPSPAPIVAALDRWERAAVAAGPDETAVALVAAWSDLQADLASVADGAPVPDRAAIDAAEARVREAKQHLALLEAATGSGPLSEAARAEIEEVHEAILRLEERSGRRIGGAGARRDLEQAKQREAELLELHGFASYIDVVLTGGCPRHDSPELMAAARSYRNAVSERDALVAASTARPELAYLDGERARLHRYITELLGVDPGENLVDLLRAHPALPSEVVEDLRRALDDVGVRPVGESLPSAAAAWLAEHARTGDHEGGAAEHARLEAEVADLAERRSSAEAAAADAEAALAEADAEVGRATRAVSSFETELSMRADEDARRLQRFAAAEQLRMQVEALSATLVTAEADSRAALERAAAEVAAAEAALDRAAGRVADLTRRARDLRSELPAARRPEEALDALEPLATELDTLAVELEGELSEAVAGREQAAAELDRARAARVVAEQALDGPQGEDHEQALRGALGAGDQVLVLDEPFGARRVEDDVLRSSLLEAAARRPLVLLTEDPDLLGWAIELPSELGRVVPVDALNLDADPAEDDEMERAILELSEQGTSDHDARTDPRWAGRR